MTACNVCHAPISEPIYTSNGHASMTTMLRLYEQPTRVSFCDRCGHLQTDEIVQPDDYYAHQYSILATTAEEDMLYAVVDGRKVFQVEHRVATLLQKVPVPAKAEVLDFGCAKGAVLERLVRERPDITPYYFEVTQRYLPFWRKLAEPHQWATGRTPSDWRDRFDLVCSFYVLEHVADPVSTLREIAGLIKPGGWLYFLVPNALANTADLIVADHLQHYSEHSLIELLQRVGLQVVEIDDRSHASAYIVVARRSPASLAPRQSPRPVTELRQQYIRMSAFWSELSNRIRGFERSIARDRTASIYGAGFYGNFIASCLGNQRSIACFVDQNPHLQGRTMLGKPIVGLAQLGSHVEVLYAGLNPALARAVIAAIPCLQARALDIFYL